MGGLPPLTEQLALPMLTVYSSARLVDAALVAACTDYRAACRLCWAQRTRINLKRATLAEEAGLYTSHTSDYFSAEPGKVRSLPADKIDIVERVLGNRAISQWLLLQTQRPDDEVLHQEAA